MVYSSVFPTSGTTNFGTMLTNTAINVPDGIYPIDVNVSGSVVNDFIYTLQSGRMWNGATNVSSIWSSSASWVGGTPPNSSSDVLFTGLGAQITDFTNGVFFANSEVDQNFTIASLRFSQVSNGVAFHSIQIDPGVTLNITGANGLSVLPDAVASSTTDFSVLSGLGGTLNVNNVNANISMLVDNSVQSTLDMSKLGTFTANVSRIAPGDFTTYPNYTNLQAQGYGTSTPYRLPNTFYFHMNLALTNFITANYIDANNYTNSNTNRLYAIQLGNNPLSAGGSGNTVNFSLGITNVFKADGLVASGFGETTLTMGFNRGLLVTTNIVPNVSTNLFTNSMVAIFRNTDGVSPMSYFVVGDLANAQPTSTGNTKPIVDFTIGRVDILADRFLMARDRTNCVNTGGDTCQTAFMMSSGILKANTLVLGDQESGDQFTNGYCQGTLTVSNSGVVIANKSIELGYDVADYNDSVLPGVTFGFLNIVSNATVMANTINVGGPSGNSGEVGYMGPSSGSAKLNTISMNGGNLIVSNVIGSAAALATGAPTHTAGIIPGMLGALNMINSSLKLFIDGNNTGPYVNTCQLNFSGSLSNTLVIGSIKNLAVPATGSTNIPLMWIQGASPNASAVSPAFTTVIVPSGFQGALVLDATNSQILDLNLSAHTPRNLLWKGYTDSNWDTTTKDWLDLNTGLHTNFDNGDFTTFDDTAGTATNITITSSVQLIPNNILVTNNTAYYKFAGASLIGGNSLTKAGTGTLEFNATMTLGITLNGGLLVGTGTIGGVAVASGTVLNYSGNVNGNVGCSGVVINNGTMTGQLTVNSGGVVTNFVNLNGTFNAKSGSFVLNAIGANITWPLGSSSTVATNATFENGGTINGDTINCSGTWLDLAVANQMTIYQFSMGAGGTFYPGDNALGATVFASATTSLSFPGALLQAQGATTVLNVNMGHNPTNTLIEVPFMNFGASSSAQTQTGSTLQINNVGSIPFAAGQTFNFFQYPGGGIPGNTGSSTNTYPVISPAYPGPGLAWDLSQLWTAGNIGVVSAASVHPVLTNSLTLLGTSNIVIQLSWNTNTFGNNSSNFFGWRVETQTDPVSTGLSLNNANWAGISGSWTNGSVNITNSVNTTNAIFYRLVFP